LSSDDVVRSRFGQTAEAMAAHQDNHAKELADRVRSFVQPRGDERALDVGAGAGALALAFAPLVREVTATDIVPELLEEARRRAPENMTVLEADATDLPFPDNSFDLVGTRATFHHMTRPELVLAEMARVTIPGGSLLIIDQLAPTDSLAAIELDRFERSRDPSHTRLLSDADLAGNFDMNSLDLRRKEVFRETRELDPYLNLAGCEGEARTQAQELAPPGYTAEIGWYLCVKRVF
jgi:ubiquinone/menaquinone biosynthesis C-methylase UbiE